jgi:hypothetical protein
MHTRMSRMTAVLAAAFFLCLGSNLPAFHGHGAVEAAIWAGATWVAVIWAVECITADSAEACSIAVVSAAERIITEVASVVAQFITGVGSAGERHIISAHRNSTISLLPSTTLTKGALTKAVRLWGILAVRDTADNSTCPQQRRTQLRQLFPVLGGRGPPNAF